MREPTSRRKTKGEWFDMKKYRILIDYGAYEGMKLWDEEGFDNLDDAVKEAQANSYGSEFKIIQIIDWKAKENDLI